MRYVLKERLLNNITHKKWASPDRIRQLHDRLRHLVGHDVYIFFFQREREKKKEGKTSIFVLS